MYFCDQLVNVNVYTLLFQANFNDKDYLTFEMLTLVPFEPTMIDYNMLTYKHVSSMIVP